MMRMRPLPLSFGGEGGLSMPRGEPQNEWTEARKGAKTMINTTKSMENTSTALAGKCGETLKNMNRYVHNQF